MPNLLPISCAVFL